MKCIAIVCFLVGTLVYGQRSDFATISFEKADSIAFKYKGSSLNNLPVLVHNLTSDLSTDVEKFRAIYTWVCTNIENDYGSYQKTVKKRKKFYDQPDALSEWNSSYTPKVFEKLLKQRKTACTGYAFLVSEMAKLAEIECRIINGYGRTPTLVLNEESIPNHSWNTVKLNDKWYLCDPTWSAGRIILKDEGPTFQADYFDSYFLADPDAFIQNHYPLETNASLLAEPPTFKAFIAAPVVYKQSFTFPIIPLAPNQMHLEVFKNEPIRFTLKTPNNFQYSAIELRLNSGGSNKKIKPDIHTATNKIFLEHTFEKTGNYDVHIQVDDLIIATYVVKVRRKKG